MQGLDTLLGYIITPSLVILILKVVRVQRVEIEHNRGQAHVFITGQYLEVFFVAKLFLSVTQCHEKQEWISRIRIIKMQD